MTDRYRDNLNPPIYKPEAAAIYYTFKRYMVGGITAGAVKS